MPHIDHAAVVAAAVAALANARQRHTAAANQHIIATRAFDGAKRERQTAIDALATGAGTATISDIRGFEERIRDAETEQLIQGQLATATRKVVNDAEIALLWARHDALVSDHRAALDATLAAATAVDVAIEKAKALLMRFGDTKFDVGLAVAAAFQHDADVRAAVAENARLHTTHDGEKPLVNMPATQPVIQHAELSLTAGTGPDGGLMPARFQSLTAAVRSAFGITAPAHSAAAE